jgi:hypothetical protein
MDATLTETTETAHLAPRFLKDSSLFHWRAPYMSLPDLG